jgi:hypothetical protein
MALGRNEPCHCGSGKKYKKCCLDQDQADARAALAPPPGAVQAPRRRINLDDDPEFDLGQRLRDLAREDTFADEDEAPDPFLEAFEALEYEEQIAQFTETLDEGAMDDIELAFGMLELIHAQSVERGHDGRFLPLLDALREHAPDIYVPDAPYYVEWRVEHALATGQAATIPALTGELATTAGDDFDTFNRIIEQLAYHGQLPILRELMHAAWPNVCASDNITEWGIAEFGDRLGPYEIFALLEEGLSPEEAAAAFPQRMAVYPGFDVGVPPDLVERYIGHLTGCAASAWTADDFAFLEEKPGTKDAEETEGQTRLFHLSIAFMGYARREEGVPYSKSLLATGQLRAYLLGRRDEDPITEEYAAKVKRPVGKAGPFAGLRPDFTLDRYIGRRLEPLNMQFHAASALVELFPAWLRFLEGRGLLTEEQREAALAVCRDVAESLFQVWDAYPSDPALAEGLRRSGLVPA